MVPEGYGPGGYGPGGVVQRYGPGWIWSQGYGPRGTVLPLGVQSPLPEQVDRRL